MLASSTEPSPASSIRKRVLQRKRVSHLSMGRYCLDSGGKFPRTPVLHITARKHKRPHLLAQR
jgi:hypothetical protein